MLPNVLSIVADSSLRLTVIFASAALRPSKEATIFFALLPSAFPAAVKASSAALTAFAAPALPAIAEELAALRSNPCIPTNKTKLCNKTFFIIFIFLSLPISSEQKIFTYIYLIVIYFRLLLPLRLHKSIILSQ